MTEFDVCDDGLAEVKNEQPQYVVLTSCETYEKALHTELQVIDFSLHNPCYASIDRLYNLSKRKMGMERY